MPIVIDYSLLPAWSLAEEEEEAATEAIRRTAARRHDGT